MRARYGHDRPARAHLRGALFTALAIAIAACSSEPSAPQAERRRAPEHGPVPPLPDSTDDPPTSAKIELGRALFYDVRLSGSGHTSCDRCHVATTSLQDGLPTGVPDRSYPDGQPRLTRNTTSMLNLAFAPIFRWDGSHTDAVEVLVFPFAEANMNLGSDAPAAQIALKSRLTQDIPGYLPLFQSAFGEDIAALTPGAVWRLAGRALLAFMRPATSQGSAFDRWNAGDDAAMSAAAVRGFDIFRGPGRCGACHTGPLFTDFAFHNVSSSPPSPSGERADEGRFLVTGKQEDRGAFLTPTLRGAIDTAPYFHDGSRPGLRKVIEHLTRDAALADPGHDKLLEPPPELSDADIDDLIELIRALRGQPISDALGPPSEMP